MPRTRVPDPCLICSEVNCSCGKPAKERKTPAPRKKATKAKAPSVPAPLPQESVQKVSSTPHPIDAPDPAKERAYAAMKARAARSRPAQGSAVERDATTEDAIRNLEGLLHSDERVKYVNLFRTSPSTNPRAAAWRQRRANAGV